MWDPNEVTPAGKTLGQIDQEQKQYVEDANRALEEKRGAPAKWWRYLPSHRTFTLVVGDPNGEGNLVLSFSTCEKISGPVEWENQNLRVVWTSAPPAEDRKWEFELRDDNVSFSLVAGTFSLMKNHALGN